MGSSFERNFNDGIGASAVETVEGERERVVEKGVCTNEPFLEFLWLDGNLRTLHGVWDS
jgi:hypothetical protein